MDILDATMTAWGAAKRLDLPAYVYREGDTFQVAAVEWEYLTKEQRREIARIVLPSGRVMVSGQAS